MTNDVDAGAGAAALGRAADARRARPVRLHPLGRRRRRAGRLRGARRRTTLAKRLALYRLRRPIAIEREDGACGPLVAGRRRGRRRSAPARARPALARARRTSRPRAGSRTGCASASPRAWPSSADKTLWLECNAAELNGVSFTKGCYVGQENTARMNWRQQGQPPARRRPGRRARAAHPHPLSGARPRRRASPHRRSRRRDHAGLAGGGAGMSGYGFAFAFPPPPHPPSGVPIQRAEIVRAYPHDPGAFTQGLLWATAGCSRAPASTAGRSCARCGCGDGAVLRRAAFPPKPGARASPTGRTRSSA